MVSDEELKMETESNDVTERFKSICTELLARRRECQAAREMREGMEKDFEYGAIINWLYVQNYDQARLATDAIEEKK